MPSGAQHDARRQAVDSSRLDPGDLAYLLSTLPDTVVRYDRGGRITYANEAFEHRTGRAVVDALGSRPFEWTDDRHLVPDRAEYQRLLEEALTTGEPRDMTRTRNGDDGHAEIFQVRFQPEIDASGHVVGAWALARNQSRLFQARQEVADRHVRVSVVEPGAVDTELGDHINPRAKGAFEARIAGVERLAATDIADAVGYIVTSPRRVAINEILIRPTEQVA